MHALGEVLVTASAAIEGRTPQARRRGHRRETARDAQVFRVDRQEPSVKGHSPPFLRSGNLSGTWG